MTQGSGAGDRSEPGASLAADAAGSASGVGVGSATADLPGARDAVSPWRTRLHVAADELLRLRSAASLLERGWVLPVVLVWAGGRAVNVILLALAFGVSRLTGWTFGTDGVPARSFVDFLSGWDAHWYGTIAASGYPTSLPLDLYGNVELNNWAFLPVFPFLERAVSEVLRMPWQLAGIVISLAASCGACLVLAALLRTFAAPRAAMWAVVLFSFGPVSYVLMLGYAESLFLLLTFSALLLAVRRRYFLIAPLGVLAAFTRPGALALALTLAIVLVGRWMRRAHDPLSAREVAGLVFSGLATAAAGLTWPFVAAEVTGDPAAYVHTETAWWVPFLHTTDAVPFLPGLLLGWVWLGPLGVAIVLGVVAATFRWILSRRTRSLGLEVVGFAFSYTLYLFVVFLPTQSVPRMVLPLTPLLADGRLSETRRRRRWSLAISLVLQAGAVLLLWVIGNP
jgi:hypothetical protein